MKLITRTSRRADAVRLFAAANQGQLPSRPRSGDRATVRAGRQSWSLAHRVCLPAQLLVVLERCTLTLSRTRCPSPSGGSRVDGGRGSGARREQTNAAAYSRLWWRAAIRAAFQHSSLPSIRRARPVARPPVRARAHSRTVCLTFRHRQAVESVNRVVC